MGKDDPGNVEPFMPENGEHTTAANLYLAQVSNYTDRPDLLIEKIEEHDPGFIRRMNEASERNAAEERDARFKFGKRQAYAGLSVSVLAAIASLGFLGLAIMNGADFWQIIAIGIVYAITQGGSFGFSRLVDAVAELLSSRNKGSNDSNQS